VTTGGNQREDEERPLRRAPQLAVLLEGGDRKGLLHDMTAAILRHGGDIVLVEIIERGARSAVYWELDGVDDPEGLMASFLEIDVVESLERLPTMYQVWGKRIIVVGPAPRSARSPSGPSARPTGTTSGARRSASTPSPSWARPTWRAPCGRWPGCPGRWRWSWPAR